jgi:hypothetical protein
MFCGPTSHERYLASFECNEHLADPNSLIAMFLDMIEFLDERAVQQWHSADSKVFDICYEADAEQGVFRSDISQEVMKRIAEAGATLRVTLYPRNDDARRPHDETARRDQRNLPK